MTAPKIAAALLFIGLNFYAYNYLANEDIIPPRELFETFPDEISAWTCVGRETMADDIIDNLGVTDYLICNYINEDTQDAINFYAGYHARQQRSDSGKTTLIHPPEHCLPGAGWDIIASEVVDIDYGIPGQAKRVVVAKGDHRQLVYFWYQSRGHVIANNTDRLMYMFLDRAMRSRTDGALLRFMIPVRRGNFDAAEETFQQFASVMLPKIPPYIPE